MARFADFLSTFKYIQVLISTVHPSTVYLASSTIKYHLLDFKYIQVQCTWLQVHCSTMYLASSTYLKPSTWYLRPSTWYLNVLEAKYTVRGCTSTLYLDASTRMYLKPSTWYLNEPSLVGVMHELD